MVGAEVCFSGKAKEISFLVMFEHRRLCFQTKVRLKAILSKKSLIIQDNKNHIVLSESGTLWGVENE